MLVGQAPEPDPGPFVPEAPLAPFSPAPPAGEVGAVAAGAGLVAGAPSGLAPPAGSGFFFCEA